MPGSHPVGSASKRRSVIACLQIVRPEWLGWFDPSLLPLYVRDTLDELEELARSTGNAATGCMEVRYDTEDGSMEWRVLIATRYDEPDAGRVESLRDKESSDDG